MTFNIDKINALTQCLFAHHIKNNVMLLFNEIKSISNVYFRVSSVSNDLQNVQWVHHIEKQHLLSETRTASENFQTLTLC